jgi:hypothetical protein
MRSDYAGYKCQECGLWRPANGQHKCLGGEQLDISLYDLRVIGVVMQHVMIQAVHKSTSSQWQRVEWPSTSGAQKEESFPMSHIARVLQKVKEKINAIDFPPD